MYLNLDKPMVLFAVLLAWPAMLTPRAAVRAVPLFAGLVLLAILLNLGVWSGTVHPEVGLPSWWLVFALSNLFLTCLTEEAFFRGYLQSAIGVWRGPVAGLVGASTLLVWPILPVGLS